MVEGIPKGLSGSLSLFSTSMTTGVSSGVVAASSTATGGSFNGPIVTMTIVVSHKVGLSGSHTTRQKVSKPTNPSFGVYVAHVLRIVTVPSEGPSHKAIAVAGVVKVVSSTAHSVTELSSGIFS